jgi:hypothetical protein
LSVLLVAKLTDPRLTAELGIPTPDRKIRAIHADAVLAAVERLIGAATDARICSSRRPGWHYRSPSARRCDRDVGCCSFCSSVVQCLDIRIPVPSQIFPPIFFFLCPFFVFISCELGHMRLRVALDCHPGHHPTPPMIPRAGTATATVIF